MEREADEAAPTGVVGLRMLKTIPGVLMISARPSRYLASVVVLLACVLCGPVRAADQSNLVPVTTPTGATLQFDWPMLSIGIGQYEEGPTGVTVFRFARKVMAAVDVRGGAPGTVNTDYLRHGYDKSELDAIVLSGGSWYGLESTTAVASALKDDGVRDGRWSNLALTAGAIVAVSTGEIEAPAAGNIVSAGVGLVASEVMWDAILASVPEQVASAVPDPVRRYSTAELRALAGTYRFSDEASLAVTVAGGMLYAQALGQRDVYGIGRSVPVMLQAAKSPDGRPLSCCRGVIHSACASMAEARWC